jgi:hypothetical protein
MVAGFFLLFENVQTAFTSTASCVENPAAGGATCPTGP